MGIDQRMQQWLENSRQRFFESDYKELDKELTPEGRTEWNSIYASYRSGALLHGTVIGVEKIAAPSMDSAGGVGDGPDEITCIVVVPYRVKILIPEPLIWWPGEERESFLLNHMGGANVDFVIIAVDRLNEFAIASRVRAMDRRRWQMTMVERLQAGDITSCEILSVGPGLLTMSCHGFDYTVTQSGLSYSCLGDLRSVYRPGQRLKAKVIAVDEGNLEISVKDAAPDPYIGAEYRHPVGSTRLATIISKYKGGVFARLTDGCTVVCRYARQFEDSQFRPEDIVNVEITSYMDGRKWLRGKIKGKIG